MITIQRFDQVQIITTKNVKYLSSTKEDVKPHGVWSVTGAIGDDLLISQDTTIVRIPATDVKVITQVDTKYVIQKLGSILNRVEREKREESPH